MARKWWHVRAQASVGMFYVDIEEAYTYSETVTIQRECKNSEALAEATFNAMNVADHMTTGWIAHLEVVGPGVWECDVQAEKLWQVEEFLVSVLECEPDITYLMTIV